MKKIYILLGLVFAFVAMTGSASAASISSPWYTSPQPMQGTLLATYKGSPNVPFSLRAFNLNGDVRDKHDVIIPFIKGQGIGTDIYSIQNTRVARAVDQFKIHTYDSNGREVRDNYGLRVTKNFDAAYITLTGTPTDVSEVLFLVMEIHNADGSIALQQFGTYFDTSQTGFAQMVIKASNLAPEQTLALYPVFKGVTSNAQLANVTFRVYFYSSNTKGI